MSTTGRLRDGASTDDGSHTQLSADTVFQTLGNRRRRHALHYLRKKGKPVVIRDLSEQLAAWELGKERAAVTPKERKRLYTALHQTHLPRMDQLNVVDYDRNRGIISLTNHCGDFDIYLDVVPQDDLPWSQFYLALGTVLTTLVTVALLGIAPFSAIGGFGYAFATAVLLTLTAAYHAVRDQRMLLGSTETPPDALLPTTDDEAVVAED